MIGYVLAVAFLAFGAGVTFLFVLREQRLRSAKRAQAEVDELGDWAEALAEERGSAISERPKLGSIGGQQVVGNVLTPQEMERLVAAEAEEQF